MKKLILATIFALVAVTSQAQSNVTVYGVVDAGYVGSTGSRQGTLNGTSDFNGVQSGVMGDSRIGFKGEEALGNGLAAIFTIEYGVNADTDVGATVARKQFVGVSSKKLGQVALGRQYAPGYDAAARADALFSSATMSPMAIMNTAGGNSIVSGALGRINNSVTYNSPTFAGFTVSSMYGFGESNSAATVAANGTSSTTNGFVGLGLNYAVNNFNADLVYQSRQKLSASTIVPGIAAANGMQAVTASTGTGQSVDEWMLAGSYDFKVVKVLGSYQTQSDHNGTSLTDAGNKVWSLGAVMPVSTNGKVHASYANLDWDRVGAGSSAAWALGYSHALSKRTTLYTTYTATTNDSNTLVAAGGVASTRAIGESNSTVTAGLNHAF